MEVETANSKQLLPSRLDHLYEYIPLRAGREAMDLGNPTTKQLQHNNRRPPWV